jgi:predicted nucleotidyltransferase
MRITKEEIVAGHPALQVRGFLRRYRHGLFMLPAAESAMQLEPQRAAEFLNDMVMLGLIEHTKPLEVEPTFRVATRGHALANATGARPITRATGERVLRDFLDRVNAVNATNEYAFGIQSAVLFGSMLSYAGRLSDVDVAIDLQSRVTEPASFRQRCDLRRYAAQEQGRVFRTVFDWAMWPRSEIMLRLKARSCSLSLHEFDQVMQMDDLNYRILVGDPDRIACQIPNGRAV